MDWNKKFRVINKTDGKLLIGNSIMISYQDSEEYEPFQVTERDIQVLNYFIEKDGVAVENVVSKPAKGKAAPLPVSVVETSSSESGKKNSHVLFDGNKAIDTQEIDMSRPAIDVQEIDMVGKAVEVEIDYEDFDYSEREAKRFLSQHWKTVESNINKIDDINILIFYLDMARVHDMTEKKIEIIEKRMQQVSNQG